MTSREESVRKPAPRRRPGAFSLGSFLGIPIFVDFSWLIIFMLLTVTISQEFSVRHPQWRSQQQLLAGLITSLLFFLCVFLHEMGHSLVARSFGIPVLSITLFIFGGVAQIKSEPRKPSHEFLIAIAGPLTSIGLSAVFFLLMLAFEGRLVIRMGALSWLGSIFAWLGGINFLLAVFNMIPGFPLDGGRVLRSGIWAMTGRFELATRAAAGVGSFVAYFFIAGGIYLALFQKAYFNGIWIAFIGWFLLTAARSSVVQMTTRRVLGGLRVGDVMDPVPYRVSPGLSIKWLVDGPILQHGHRTFVVEDNGTLRGLVTMHEVKVVPREEWPNTPLQSIMIPAQNLVVVEPRVSLDRVIEVMDERGINQMPVVDSNRVVGMVTREGILRVLRNQLELGRRW